MNRLCLKTLLCCTADASGHGRVRRREINSDSIANLLILNQQTYEKFKY